MDDEDGLGCSVEATLLETLLLAGLQVAALLLQIQTLPHVVLDDAIEMLAICRQFIQSALFT